MPDFPTFDGRSDPAEWPSQTISPLPFNFETFNGADNNLLPSGQQYGALHRQSTTDSMTSYLPFALPNDLPSLQSFDSNDQIPNQALVTPSHMQQQSMPMFYPPQLNPQFAFQNQQLQPTQQYQQYSHAYPHDPSSNGSHQRSASPLQGSSPSTTSPYSDPSSPSAVTYSSNSSINASASEAPVVVATAVAEDSTLVKKVRHREIDRKRRLREQNVMTRLAALVNEFDQDFNNRQPQEQTVARRGKTKAKTLDRVALLEAACDRLEANKRELQLHYMIANSRLRDMSVKLVSLAADTGHKIDTDSIYDSVPKLTGLQSMHWLLIQAELEAAHSRNETDPNFALTLPPSSMFTTDFRPSQSDPNFSHFMKSMWLLFRGDVPSVQVTFTKPDAANNWIETSTVVWIAPKPRFYGRVDSDRSLTRGRIIVMAGRNYPNPPVCPAQPQIDNSNPSGVPIPIPTQY